MASNLKEDIKKEIRKLNSLGVSDTQKALLEGLYDAVDDAKGDREIRQVLWANRDLTRRLFINDDFKIMPKLAEIVMSPAPSDNINLDKEFGKDWYKDFGNIPLSQIQFLADKNGLDWKKLNQTMAEEATRRTREDIAHGRWDDRASLSENLKNELGGTLLTLFGRRQQESIGRGEEPSVKDYAGDAIENGLYAVPWGRALGAGGKVAAALQYAGANTAAPLVSETYDKAVYHNDKDNPRSKFSVGDVATGTGVNMAMPVFMRGVLTRAGRYAPAVKEVGERVGKQDVVSREQLAKELATVNPQARAQYFNELLNEGKKLSPELQEFAVSYDAAKKQMYDRILNKLRNGESLTEAEIKFAVADPYLNKFRYIDRAPSEARLAGEESVKNLITNELGSDKEIGNSALNRIPFAGPWLAKKVKEDEEEEEALRKQKEIEDKWKIILGVK